MAKGENVYATLGGTNISLTQLCAAFEGTAKFSTGTKYEEEFKIFEGEANLGQLTLKLFPDFASTSIQKKEKCYEDWRPWGLDGNDMNGYYAEVKVKPRGFSLPYYVGAVVYDSEKNLIEEHYYEDQMYSFFNSYNETSAINLPLYHGKFYIVPLLNVLGTTVPAWSAAKEVQSTVEITMRMYSDDTLSEYNQELPMSLNVKGWLDVGGVMPGDNVEVKIEDGRWTHDMTLEKRSMDKDKSGYMMVQRYWFEYNYVPGARESVKMIVTVRGPSYRQYDERLQEIN